MLAVAVAATTDWSNRCNSQPEHFNYKMMGVSENSVPLNPMVNDHYPY